MHHDSSHTNGSSDEKDSKDMLYLTGGLALMVLGAGLVMANSTVRRAVGAGIGAVLPGLQDQFGSQLSAIGPDIQRYFKLRQM